MDKTLLSYQEVQEIIGRSRSTISRWVADGLFPAPQTNCPPDRRLVENRYRELVRQSTQQGLIDNQRR